MAKEIMQCRNGCGSKYLDRQYNARFQSDGKGLLIAEYHCRNCEWRAVWDTKSKRLMINNDGKVEIQYSSDPVTAMIEAMDQVDEDEMTGSGNLMNRILGSAGSLLDIGKGLGYFSRDYSSKRSSNS